MGKNRDVVSILIIVIIGMFIPFLGSIAITFGLDLTKADNLLKISSTFGYFLLIFGIELIIVYIYYKTTNKIASKKLEKLKNREV
jgi:hypothetical protein